MRGLQRRLGQGSEARREHQRRRAVRTWGHAGTAEGAAPAMTNARLPTRRLRAPNATNRRAPEGRRYQLGGRRRMPAGAPQRLGRRRRSGGLGVPEAPPVAPCAGCPEERSRTGRARRLSAAGAQVARARTSRTEARRTSRLPFGCGTRGRLVVVRGASRWRTGRRITGSGSDEPRSPRRMAPADADDGDDPERDERRIDDADIARCRPRSTAPLSRRAAVLIGGPV